MAESEESSSREDLSEEPSQRKIEEYRNRGMVAQSKELTAMMAFLATLLVFVMRLPVFVENLSLWIEEICQWQASFPLSFSSTDLFLRQGIRFLKVSGSILLPVFLATLTMGILVSFAQIGSIFSWDPLMPQWEKINPILGFKKFFSFEYLIECIRILLKFCVFFSMTIFFVFSFIPKMIPFLFFDVTHLGIAYFDSVRPFLISLTSILLAFAGIDFLIQKWNFSKKVRLTKQEAKQEHKEREGDPQVKSRVRAIQREFSRKRMMKAVKKADVIVTNPTHLAVAIWYQKEVMSAPKVVAKGADLIAQKIKQIGSEANIPLVENVPLARALYKSVKIGQTVPRNLYQAVAEVLAYVYQLKRKRF